MEWQKVLYLVGALFAAWLIYRSFRNNPQAFSRESIGKSVFTIGILALILIAFIALLVLLVRS